MIASYDYDDTDLLSLGRETFRTDYARIAGIETSGLTHTEATVTVSLPGADIGRKYFTWYPHSNKGEAERDYTFYLRHKPSDEDDWSEPVELDFSGYTADARLTGLDPGTDYDVEVSENRTFTPQQASTGSYQATLTVGEDSLGYVGYDPAGIFGEIYGSISPTTFEVGGVEHSIVALWPTEIPPDTGNLQLTFDRPLPDDAAFTLTLGTTEFNSSDAVSGHTSYSWHGGGPTWSDGQQVTVELDFTTAVVFREGTTREGAFTTPTMPPTLAFEAEMTVGTRFVSGETILGYNASLSRGSLSDTTFEVGGVEYTVKQVDLFDTQDVIVLSVSPAGLHLELEVGGVTYDAENAQVSTGSEGNTYRWSRTGSPWTFNTQVSVRLDVPLINICGRPSAVADAIVKATPSFDFCHMTSQLDLAGITELDLSGVHLGGHSWNQLPVGVFDGLDSLEVLDLSDTHLQNLNRGIFGGLSNLIKLDLSDTLLQGNDVPVGVFDGLDSLEILRIADAGYRGRGINFVDEDIFRGLNTLLELDVGPIRPPDDVLAPLTSLETLNGEDYTP